MTYQQTIMEHETKARNEGISLGMERLAMLIKTLVDKGRNDDVVLATSDEAARNRLLAEFGI